MTEQERFESGKDQARALWEAGDYDALVRTFHTFAAADLAASLDDVRGARVLDVACGTGESSFPLARRGFEVVGIDMSPHLLAVARRNAQEQDLAITFDAGFLEEMPYPDASFAAAVSMFGLMFSSAPRMAAAEIARVMKPGAQLALASSTQAGFSGRMNDVVAPYLPSMPADAPSFYDWGDAAKAPALLEPYFDAVEAEAVPLVWSVDLPPAETARRFVDTAGPIQFIMGFLAEEQRKALLADFERFWADNNRSGDPDSTIVDNEFLRVFAYRKQPA